MGNIVQVGFMLFRESKLQILSLTVDSSVLSICAIVFSSDVLRRSQQKVNTRYNYCSPVHSFGIFLIL